MVIEDTPEIGTEPYLIFISKNQKDLASAAAVYSKLKIGHRIRTIHSMGELILFMDMHQSNEWPSLIVLDVDKQKEGVQFLNEWKRKDQYKHIPVLIYTDTLNYQEEKEWLNLGAAYCRKKRKTNEETQKLLIEFISLADILHEIKLDQH